MGKIILENLIPLVFAVITPILLLFVHKLVSVLAKKWHLEELEKYNAQLDELIIKGIKAIEQKSLTAVKLGRDKTSSEKKLEECIKWVNEKLVAEGLPGKAGSELAMLIEAKLFGGAANK